MDIKKVNLTKQIIHVLYDLRLLVAQTKLTCGIYRVLYKNALRGQCLQFSIACK